MPRSLVYIFNLSDLLFAIKPHYRRQAGCRQLQRRRDGQSQSSGVVMVVLHDIKMAMALPGKMVAS